MYERKYIRNVGIESERLRNQFGKIFEKLLDAILLYRECSVVHFRHMAKCGRADKTDTGKRCIGFGYFKQIMHIFIVIFNQTTSENSMDSVKISKINIVCTHPNNKLKNPQTEDTLYHCFRGQLLKYF